MADFVIGDDLFFMGRKHCVLALVARHHHVYGFRQVFLCDDAAVALDGAQRGFVDKVGKLCAGRAGGGPRHGLIINVVGHHHVLGMDTQNGLAALQVRQFDGHTAVETAGAQKRLVQRFGTVGCRQNDDAGRAVEAVHLAEQLVERLLAFVVARDAAAVTLFADGVDLVDEHDAGGLFFRLFEQVAHTGRALSHEHLHKLAARDGEKRHIGLAGHSLGQQRLAGARRADKQNALGHYGAHAAVFIRIVQEIHDLLQRFLGLLLPGHVGKGLARLSGHVHLGVTLAHAEGHHIAAVAHALLHHTPQQHHGKDQDERGEDPGEQEIHQGAVFLRSHGGKGDAALGQALLQVRVREHARGVDPFRPVFICSFEIKLTLVFLQLHHGHLAARKHVQELVIAYFRHARGHQAGEHKRVQQHQDEHRDHRIVKEGLFIGFGLLVHMLQLLTVSSIVTPEYDKIQARL